MTFTWSSFSSRNHKNFLIVSKDNRLHLWDSQASQEKRTYVEKFHLSHTYVCFAWYQMSPSDLGLLAIGTNDGTVVLWDLIRGVVKKTFGEIRTDPPVSISFSSDGKILYCSTSSNIVVSYNIETGQKEQELSIGKKGPLRLCLDSQDNLVASSTSIRLYDIKTGKKRKLDAYFAGGVIALNFSNCSRYLGCAGASSREILLFDTHTIERKLPINTIATTGINKQIYIQTHTAIGKQHVYICSIFDDSTSTIFKSIISDSNNEDDNPPTIEICQLECQLPILSAQFISSSELIFAIGKVSQPHFVKVIYESTEGIFLDHVIIPHSDSTSSSKNSSTATGTTASNKTNATAVSAMDALTVVLGPHETGGMKRPLVDTTSASLSLSSSSVTAAAASKKARTLSDADSNHEIVPTANHKAEDEMDQTLEERLEALSSSLAMTERAAEEGAAGKNIGSSRKSKSSLEEAPTSDSLVVLIDQALQSGDDSLLEQCLNCEDVDVVEATARRLQSGKVLSLLRRLVAKFEKRPSRGILLTRWLAAILRHHTAFLVSVPDLANQLAGLSQMLEQRLSSYTKLASLGGRLDLMMAQIISKGSSQGEKSESRPKQVYIDEPNE